MLAAIGRKRAQIPKRHIQETLHSQYNENPDQFRKRALRKLFEMRGEMLS